MITLTWRNGASCSQKAQIKQAALRTAVSHLNINTNMSGRLLLSFCTPDSELTCALCLFLFVWSQSGSRVLRPGCCVAAAESWLHRMKGRSVHLLPPHDAVILWLFVTDHHLPLSLAVLCGSVYSLCWCWVGPVIARQTLDNCSVKSCYFKSEFIAVARRVDWWNGGWMHKGKNKSRCCCLVISDGAKTVLLTEKSFVQ